MRITEQARREIRAKILEKSVELFVSKGFEETTTRDIANATRIASGTLFNYFPSKETLAMHLVATELAAGQADYLRHRDDTMSLVEELFLYVAAGLRRLRPYRSFLGPVFEKSLSPFPRKTICPKGDSVRGKHLQHISKMLAHHGYEATPDSAPLTLYWSLYLGILAFWLQDHSPHQQESQGMIDYSLRVFVQSITGMPAEGRGQHVE